MGEREADVAFPLPQPAHDPNNMGGRGTEDPNLYEPEHRGSTLSPVKHCINVSHCIIT